jgi:hypothetical protein
LLGRAILAVRSERHSAQSDLTAILTILYDKSAKVCAKILNKAGKK